jgi:DNA mismatch repair protein MutL
MAIKILTPEVVSKIAAGEVVERPASVVKELIENSLDAGATQVSIEARGGGVSLLRVSDNGVGIPADEVELAFHRYATSKINAMDDLDAISSLGFRGEALPSIAAVAEVEVLTRPSDEVAGTYLKLQDGKAVEKVKRGCPRGTTVTVRNLFRNVPARLKFLKSVATESSHISNLVSQYCLAFPEVRFSLIMEGRMALNTPGSGSLRDALVKVYGLKTAEAMIQVKEEEQLPRISGFVSAPSLARSSRSHLSFFVNRRWVKSRLMSRAAEDAYQGMLMVGRHPIAVLNISIPGEDVDVNVHPTKTEVRFRYEHALFAAVQKAVRAALIEQMPVPQVRQPTPVVSPIMQEPLSAKKEDVVELPLFAPAEPERRLPILRVLGQIASAYIIAEGPDGLYLIDQHAAHERIVFERVRAQRARREVEVQGLLEPITVEVTPRQEEMLKAGEEILADYGFAIEPFGQRTYLVRAVPALVKERVAEALGEVLDSLSSERDAKDWEQKIALSLACHSAIRAGQVLSQDEMHQLVQELEQTELPLTCPHGRPTLIRFSSSQLEREFGRG